MKVIITGGAGFIGTNLALKLSIEHDVLILDDLSRFGSEQNLEFLKRESKNISFMKVDVINFSIISKIIKSYKPWAIVHLAGQVAMSKSIDDPVNDFQINCMGTLNVLEAVRLFSPTTIVGFASTNKVYGDLSQIDLIESEERYEFSEKLIGFSESSKLDLTTPYGISKGCADQYVLDYFKTYSVKSFVLRLSSIYGPRQFSDYNQGWVGYFMREYLNKVGHENSTITVSGDGKQVRDLLFVDDLVDCFVRCMTNIKTTAGNVYNIGGGIQNSISILELIRFLNKFYRSNVPISETPFRLSDQKLYITDFAKATNDFGWKPKTTLLDGLNKMREWVESS